MRLSLAIFILFFIKSVKSESSHIIPAKWDTLYEEESEGNMSITIFRFDVDENNLVARVIMRCNNNSKNNPLLVVFKERQMILSLQVPTVVDNYEYSEAARTLITNVVSDRKQAGEQFVTPGGIKTPNSTKSEHRQETVAAKDGKHGEQRV